MIKLKIPASSGNIGPGFDTLGIAVNLQNYFEVEKSYTETRLEILGGLDTSFHGVCLEMINAAAQLFFKRSGLEAIDFTIRIKNVIPIARGLASSATIRLAVMAGLNQLLDATVTSDDLVMWAAELEGCTDNVAACYYGGLTASGVIGKKLFVYRFDIPDDIDFIAVSPADEVETDKARHVFSDMLPREDAVFTLNRGILLACALAQEDWDDIGDLFDDRLHQPQRQARIPALKPLFDVIQEAQKAGALGAYLSGSGSTMMALAKGNKEAISIAMQQAMARYGMKADVRFLKADNQGLQYGS